MVAKEPLSDSSSSNPYLDSPSFTSSSSSEGDAVGSSQHVLQNADFFEQQEENHHKEKQTSPQPTPLSLSPPPSTTRKTRSKNSSPISQPPPSSSSTQQENSSTSGITDQNKNTPSSITASKQTSLHTFKYDIFMSYNGGYDENGRDNRKRVQLVHDALKAEKQDLKIYFDNTTSDGGGGGVVSSTTSNSNLNSTINNGSNDINQITKEIEDSKYVLVFITQQYIARVAGDGLDGKNDICKNQFDYSCNRRGISNMLVVVNDPWCRRTTNWKGAVGAKLGNQLYGDFTQDEKLAECVSFLIKTMGEIEKDESGDDDNNDNNNGTNGLSTIKNSIRTWIGSSLVFATGGGNHSIDPSSVSASAGVKSGSVTSVRDKDFTDNWGKGDRQGRYTGEVNEYGERHGSGKMSYYDGGKFIGMFKHNLMQGKGKMLYVGNEVYDGEWHGGKKSGHGTYKRPSTQIYDGFDVYKGMYKSDLKHGQGTMTYANGTIYKGWYKDGKRHGNGIIRCNGETVFEGEFEMGNRKRGIGTYVWDNNKYVGEMKDETKDGNGKTVFANGDVYEGMYKHDKRDGRGIYTFKNGGSYDGDWRDGFMEGYGTRIYQNGNTYAGEFVKGRKQGKGVAKVRIRGEDNNDDFRVYDGQWISGEFVSNSQQQNQINSTEVLYERGCCFWKRSYRNTKYDAVK